MLEGVWLDEKLGWSDDVGVSDVCDGEMGDLKRSLLRTPLKVSTTWSKSVIGADTATLTMRAIISCSTRRSVSSVMSERTDTTKFVTLSSSACSPNKSIIS